MNYDSIKDTFLCKTHLKLVINSETIKLICNEMKITTINVPE